MVNIIIFVQKNIIKLKIAHYQKINNKKNKYFNLII